MAVKRLAGSPCSSEVPLTDMSDCVGDVRCFNSYLSAPTSALSYREEERDRERIMIFVSGNVEIFYRLETETHMATHRALHGGKAHVISFS